MPALTADLRPARPAPERPADRAVGREVVRRPVNETAVMPAAGGAGGAGDEIPPSLRGAGGGRHRGPRRPAVFRAAVPVVAVLAAGGGALGLVHATGSGTPESQALDSTSRTAESAVTTDLSNAPSGVDGANGAPGGSDPASSALDHSTPAPGAQTSGGSVGTRSATAGAPASGPYSGGPVSGSATASAPATTASTSPVVNGPVQDTTPPPLPGTPVSSAPTATTTPPPATTPAPPNSSPSGSASGTPPTGGTTTTPPTTPVTSPTPPATTPPATTPTPTPTPTGNAPTPTPSGPTDPPPTTRTLQTGDTGPDVSALQTDLDRLRTPNWIPVTGVYDSRTADAVAYVQNQLNITADERGVCGPTTAAAISTLAARA